MKKGFKIMDSDIHLFEPPDIYERYLEDRFKPLAPKYVSIPGWPQGNWLMNIPGREEEVLQTRTDRTSMNLRKERILELLGKNSIEDVCAPPSTLHGMETEGIDVAIVFRTLVAGHVSLDDLDPEYAIAVCRAFNNYLVDFCKADPDRLKGCAMLSLHSVELAVEEARRAVTELGMVGLTLAPSPIGDRYLHDPECDALWREAQELNVPVCFHDTNGGVNRHHSSEFLRGHPNATTLTQTFGFSPGLMQALGSFIIGGVLDRFPTLRVAFLEGNCGWLPWLLWRLEEQWDMYGETEEIQLSMSPTEYFLRQCYVSVDPDEAPAKYVVDALGDNNLVISSDFPHFDSLYPDAMAKFLQLQEISDETKRKVLWDNCARLYNL